MTNERDVKAIHEYWEERASLMDLAGSQDILAKTLEMRAIGEYVRDGQVVLEAGCGNGIAALYLAERFDVRIVAFDYAEKMIEAARERAKGSALKGTVEFRVGDVTELEAESGLYDLIYTERMLINLQDWETQRRVITKLASLLKPGGAYLMCENSLDGLAAINDLRLRVGLEAIKPPWHNIYFNDADLATLEVPGVILEAVNPFSATYYFLSRVVNAWLAAQEGRKPEYMAPVNQLALSLPSVGDTAQGRIWVWRRQA